MTRRSKTTELGTAGSGDSDPQLTAGGCSSGDGGILKCCECSGRLQSYAWISSQDFGSLMKPKKAEKTHTVYSK